MLSAKSPEIVIHCKGVLTQTVCVTFLVVSYILIILRLAYMAHTVHVCQYDDRRIQHRLTTQYWKGA